MSEAWFSAKERVKGWERARRRWLFHSAELGVRRSEVSTQDAWYDRDLLGASKTNPRSQWSNDALRHNWQGASQDGCRLRPERCAHAAVLDADGADEHVGGS